MSDTTCVMQPFSYTTSSELSIETSQENEDVYGMIEESVSFGRYREENMSREKWSKNRNRYVEEAVKYSIPGSVAEKKAFFEEYFKRMAALKAKALLEQANAGKDIEGEEGEGSGSDSKRVVEESENAGGVGFVVHHNELYSDGGENEQQEVNADMRINSLMQEKIRERNEMDGVGVTGETSCLNEEEWSGIMQTDKVPLQAMFEEEDSAAIVKKNPPLSSYMLSIRSVGRTSVLASSPAKSVAAVYPGKENFVTPVKPKPLVNDLDKKIRTPLRASINREFNKILSPVIRKIGTSSKSSTPSNTHAKDTWRDRPEPSPMTPNLTKRGPRNQNDPSTCDSKVPRPRWNILTTEGFRSPNIGRNKISSPIIPTSFCLKTGERSAARRKQKLEEKFNATTMEKAPQPSKLKEKAEAELNKLRHTFCFKTISSPDDDHCGDHEASKGTKHKNEATHIASSWQSRGHQSSTYESTSFLPPRRPTSKKQVLNNRMHLRNIPL